MPRIAASANNMEDHASGTSHYGFSAVRIDHLGASEYTLCTLCVDCSGSVFPFQQQIEDTVKAVVKDLRLSPRADNLLLRVVAFNHQVREVHGFKPLAECPLDEYTGKFTAGGFTALFDTTLNAVEAQTEYAKHLQKNDYACNGIVVVITDGRDEGPSGGQGSTMGTGAVRAALESARKTEALESTVTILLGVNAADPGLADYLTRFKDEVGFSQFERTQDMKEHTAAKLAGFVSRSVSAQSQALGTGGPSQALVF